MAIKLVKVGNSFNSPQKSYICDDLSELSGLERFGDLALVPDGNEAKTYIWDGTNWVEYHVGGGGSGGGVTEERVRELIELAKPEIKVEIIEALKKEDIVKKSDAIYAGSQVIDGTLMLVTVPTE